MNCINYSSPEYKSLLSDSGLTQMELDAKILEHQEVNNTDTFPSLENIKVEPIVDKTKAQQDMDIVLNLKANELVTEDSNIIHGIFVKPSSNISQIVSNIKEQVPNRDILVRKDAFITEIILADPSDKITRDKRTITATMFQNIVSKMSDLVPGIITTPLSDYDFNALGIQYGITSNTQAFVLGDTVFFNSESTFLTGEVALEESLHPLVLGINKTNPELFSDLFEDAKQNYPKLWSDIKANYKQNQSLELVTQSLAREFANIENNKLSKSVVLRAIEAIKNFFNRMFNYNSKSVLNSPKTALEQLILDLNTKSTVVQPYFTSEFIQENVRIVKGSDYKRVTLQAAKDIQDALNIRLRRMKASAKVNKQTLFDLDKFIKSISQGKLTNEIFKVINQSQITEENLALLESEIALVEFIDQINKDITNKNNTLQDYLNREADGIVAPITVDVLNDLKENFIDFHKQIIDSTKDVFSAKDNLLDLYTDYYNAKNEKELDNNTLRRLYRTRLDRTIARFDSLEQNYKKLRTIVLERELTKNLNEMNAPEEVIQTIVEELATVGYDSHMLASYLASTNYVKDNMIRLMSYYITLGKERVANKLGDKLQSVQKLLNKVDATTRYNLDQFFSEYDKNGKKTGNWLTRLNHGQAAIDYDKGFQKLLSEFGIEDRDQINNETFKDKRTEFIKKENALKAKHYERRFSEEYYNLQAELLPESIDAKSEIDEQILILLDSVTDDDGTLHTERLTARQVERYEQLKRNKRNLANIYDENGELKSGIDLEIAKNIQEYNESLRNQFKNVIRSSDFNKEWARLKKNVADKVEGADRVLYNWEKVNVVTRYDDKFWESLNSVSAADYGPRYAELQDRRSKLFRLFRHTYDIQIDVDQISEPLREEIKQIDKEMYEIRKQTKVKSNFKNVAEMIPSSDYYFEKSRFIPDSEEYYKWFRENHYPITVRGQQQWVPYSYWMYLKPVDGNMIHQEASNLWSDVSNESVFANEKFNEEQSHFGLMPRKDLYDNSTNFNKITSNPDLMNLYNELRQIMSESQDLQTFRKTGHSLLLPQIVGKFGSKLKAESGFMKKIKFLIRDYFTIDEDDEGYNTRVDETRFKSERNNRTIPVYFNRKIKNPNALTKDITGSVLAYYKTSVNYQEMTDILPKLKLMIEQIQDRKIEIQSNRNNKAPKYKDAATSNTYNVGRNLLDNHVFMNRSNLTFPIPDFVANWLGETSDVSGVRLSANKIISAMRNYFVLYNLGYKLPAIFADFVSAQVDLETEGLVDRYIDTASLAKGKVEMIKAIPQWLMDSGTNVKHNKLVSLMALNEMSFDRSSQISDLHLTGFGSNKLRALKQNALFFGWNTSDFLVKAQMTAAAYMNYKLIDGELMDKQTYIRKYHNGDKTVGRKSWNSRGETLYDKIKNKNGELIIEDPSFNKAYNDEVKVHIKGLLHKVMSEIDGQMRETDKAKLHTNVIGNYVTMHRGFMIMNYYKQFKPKQYDFFSQREEYGNVRGAAKYLASNIGMMNLIKSIYSKEARQAVKDGHNEAQNEYIMGSLRYLLSSLSFITIATLMSMLYFQPNADDDTDDADAQLAALLASRTVFEMRSKYSALEVMNIIKSPTAALGWVNKFTSFSNLLIDDTVKSGLYKGMSRREKQLIELTPFKNVYEIMQHDARYYRKKNEYLYQDDTFYQYMKSKDKDNNKLRIR